MSNYIKMMEYKNLLYKKGLSEVDSDTALIIDFEEERQKNKIILIPSESICPKAVREALGSSFTNIYAEGYPALRMSQEEEKELLDFECQLSYYRRYSNRRFYKGCEYADFIESLAKRRIAKCFATAKVRAEEIFVNVQPLSGTAANNSVYEAFCKPGDTVMGMSLSVGGHLTHGSSVNRSGKRYNIVSYGVDSKTELLDYEKIEKLALKYKPKMIIAGYTSYPWAPDWRRLRKIASQCVALLFADISHPAGLVIAGFYPNPVGYADVITFTTHKTICGPRAAVILTMDKEKAKKIESSVFPGEQGGPHVNKFAAIAVTFKIAQTRQYHNLQKRIVENCKVLASALQKEGLKLAYGGTNTHLLVIDLRKIKGRNDYFLKGEPAARILDIAGIVTNKNTIPGDAATALASGIRLGTPWVTQRGFGPSEMRRLAKVIAAILTNIKPFSYIGLTGDIPRGKIDFEILQEAKEKVRTIIGRKEKESFSQKRNALLRMSGKRAETFLQQVVTSNISSLKSGESLPTLLFNRDGTLLDAITLKRGERFLMLCSSSKKMRLVKSWLEELSNGYVIFDEDILAKINGPVTVGVGFIRPETTGVINSATVLSTLFSRNMREELSSRKLLTATVAPTKGNSHAIKLDIKENNIKTIYKNHPELFSLSKPYFIGQKRLRKIISLKKTEKKAFIYRKSLINEATTSLQHNVVARFIEQKEKELKKTPLYQEHWRRGAKISPFAGWEMPISYTSIIDEHQAVRRTAGLFDIGHMGMIEIKGKGAISFLDTVTTNYVWRLKNGESFYSFILNPDGDVLDDVLLYRRNEEDYLLVCNCINQEKIWRWLNAVNSKQYLIDEDYPQKEIEEEVILRNLSPVRDSSLNGVSAQSAGKEQKTILALQGPNSLLVLKRIIAEGGIRRLEKLQKREFIETSISGKEVIVAYTGYTGEKIGFEIFLSATDSLLIWNLLLEKGKELGVTPAGLGARDSTRIEAGFPLWGKELAGKFDISPIEAGAGFYVKFHKPWFVGREALLRKKLRKRIIPFEMTERAIPREGCPIIFKNKKIGEVTSGTFSPSCVKTSEGLPSTEKYIGLAYVDVEYSNVGQEFEVEIRKKNYKAKICNYR